VAVYYARKAGNVNAVDVWATTPSGAASDVFSTFTSSDVLMANSFAITLNVNTTVAEIRTDNANSATAGGSFTLNNSITLTASVFAGSTSASLSYTGNSPNSASIVGAISGGSGTPATGAVTHSGTGTLNITGNITGGSGSQANGARITGGGTLNVTGNVTGGSASAAHGVEAATNASTVNITGTVTGGTHAAAFGVVHGTTGTTTVTGTAVGGSAGLGMSVTAAGTVTVTRAKGNGFGNGSAGLSAAVGISNTSQGSATRIYEIEHGDLGQSPTAGPIIMLNDTSNVALFYRTSGGKKTLIDSAASAGHPAASNVRSGVSFANGNQTGTCAVPAAGSVALGVAVDNTSGTAVLTQANVETALGAFSSGRLANCATVASVGQQLADALTTP
jgi:hypothetical protein